MGLWSRMIWVLHHAVYGFGNSGLDHYPGRAEIRAVIVINDIMRREIIQCNGCYVAHASRAGTRVQVPIGQESIDDRDDPFVVSIDHGVVDIAHNEILFYIFIRK